MLIVWFFRGAAKVKIRNASTIALLFLVLNSAGCNGSSPATERENTEPLIHRNPVYVDREHRALGWVESSKVSAARFVVSSLSSKEVSLRLGSPSCTCIMCDLSNSKLSAKGACCNADIRIREGHVGPANARVPLYVNDGEQVVFLSTTAIVGGVRHSIISEGIHLATAAKPARISFRYAVPGEKFPILSASFAEQELSRHCQIEVETIAEEFHLGGTLGEAVVTVSVSGKKTFDRKKVMLNVSVGQYSLPFFVILAGEAHDHH